MGKRAIASERTREHMQQRVDVNTLLVVSAVLAGLGGGLFLYTHNGIPTTDTEARFNDLGTLHADLETLHGDVKSGCAVLRKKWESAIIENAELKVKTEGALAEVERLKNELQTLKDAAPAAVAPAAVAPAAATECAPCTVGCSQWTAFIESMRKMFPKSHIPDTIPHDLTSFWDLVHIIFFAEGWQYMPGLYAHYSKEARRNLVKSQPGDEDRVVNGQMRPGTLNAFFMGQTIQKYPQDMWLYMELFYDNMPDVIVECGSYNVAAAAFYAVMMEKF